MTDKLTFDVPRQKAGLVEMLNARLATQGNCRLLLGTNLRDIAFTYEDIPNKEQVITDVKNSLATTQNNCADWVNKVNPDLVVTSQAYINVGTAFLAMIPDILGYLDKDDADAAKNIAKLLREVSVRLEKEINQITYWRQRCAAAKTIAIADASHFSQTNESFQALFDADKDSLDAAQKVLGEVQARIKTLQKKVDDETVNKHDGVDYVAISMTVASVIFEGAPIAALSLAIDVYGVISRGIAIQQLVSEIDQLFDTLKQEAADKLEITLLTQQLMALQSTMQTSADFPTTIEATMDALQKVIDNLVPIKANIDRAVLALSQTDKPSKVLDKFNLGQTDEEWREMLRFAQAAEDLPLDAADKVWLTFPTAAPTD